jgi:alanine dehydrogenase
LTNGTNRFIELLADYGLEEACQRQPALRGGINVMDGKLTYQVVAEAHGLPYHPLP